MHFCMFHGCNNGPHKGDETWPGGSNASHCVAGRCTCVFHNVLFMLMLFSVLCGMTTHVDLFPYGLARNHWVDQRWIVSDPFLSYPLTLTFLSTNLCYFSCWAQFVSGLPVAEHYGFPSVLRLYFGHFLRMFVGKWA